MNVIKSMKTITPNGTAYTVRSINFSGSVDRFQDMLSIKFPTFTAEKSVSPKS